MSGMSWPLVLANFELNGHLRENYLFITNKKMAAFSIQALAREIS